MIDYEKLGRLDGEELENYLNGLVKYWEDKVKETKELIAKHKLTKPEPKYKIGSVVFYRNDLRTSSFRIDEIIEDGELWYINRNDEGDCGDDEGNFDQYLESDLFPSRQALIEHQLQYWRAGLEDELEQHVSPYCEPFSTCCKKCNEEFSKCECNFKSECQPKHDHLWVRGKCHDCGAEKDECNHDGYMTCRKCGMSFKRAFL